MRIIVTCLAILIISSSYSQEPFFSSDSLFEAQCNNWEFEDVIIVEGDISSEKLFIQARQWMAETFVSSEQVIDNADIDAGIIYGTGIFPSSNDVDGNIKFNIELRFKDGRYKYTLSGFTHVEGFTKNTYGTKATGGQYYDMGPLTQTEARYGMMVTGRGNKNKFWQSIKWKAKSDTYFFIQEMKLNLEAETIEEEDDW